MYARVTKSETWLVVVGNIIFIDEIIDPVKVSFSKILEQMGKRDTGQYLFTISLEIFLCTGIILPLFSVIWKNSLLKAIFIYNWQRRFFIVMLHNFTIHIEIPSWPWALFGFIPLINFKIFLQSVSKSLSLFLHSIFDFLEECYRLALLNKRIIKDVSLFPKDIN